MSKQELMKYNPFRFLGLGTRFKKKTKPGLKKVIGVRLKAPSDLVLLLRQGADFTIVTRDNGSGEMNSMLISANIELIEHWFNGEDNRLIQHAFPKLSAQEREFLLTGLTPQAFDAMFTEQEN